MGWGEELSAREDDQACTMESHVCMGAEEWLCGGGGGGGGGGG